METLMIPLMTEYDPAESSEGSIDPLGTGSLSANIAALLVPSMRENQKFPRFLTAIAVGLEVCRDIGQDIAVKDEVTSPEMAFEWLYVECLVKALSGGSENEGMPGSMKAARALQVETHLSAARYLKIPTVFGFHGVYGQLGRQVGIDGSCGIPGEAGVELLNVWEKEQGLAGFRDDKQGIGRDFRQELQRAIKETLEKGEVVANAA